MNFIRTSYSTYYRQKGRGGGYITRTSLEVSRNDTALKLLKNSTQALEACDEVNREVLHSDAITYLSRIVQKMIPTQTNFTLNYD